MGKGIKDLMFVAGDKAKHDVTWSDAGNHWFLENERLGRIESHINLSDALKALALFSNVPIDSFTIADNPYRMEGEVR